MLIDIIIIINVNIISLKTIYVLFYKNGMNLSQLYLRGGNYSDYTTYAWGQCVNKTTIGVWLYVVFPLGLHYTVLCILFKRTPILYWG